MSKPKLFYFDAPISRGEECRLAFAVAGVDFEDVRLPREQWQSMKPTTPFGAMPILEVAGKPLAQSTAILTYIGRSHGLHPTDLFEAARHEAMMAHLEHVRHEIAPTLRMTDEEEKKKARAALTATNIPTWAAFAEKQISDDGPFFGGAKLCVVDLKIYMVVGWIMGGKIDHIPSSVLGPYPKLMRVKSAVGDHPAVKAWQAKH
jgi:glutathione S-transferase